MNVHKKQDVRFSSRVMRGFTLIELLASMAVLVVLMGVVFQLLAGAQRAWELVIQNAEVYENARIAFDVVGRDLEAAIAWEHDIQNNHIVFRQANPNLASPYASPDLCFVSEQDVTDSAAGVVEIGYRYDAATHVLERALLDTTDSDWNPYRTGGGRAAIDPFFGLVAPEKKGTVIDGVLSLTFVCLDAAYNPQPWDNSRETTLPAAVVMTVMLIDGRSYHTWKAFDDAGNVSARKDLENRRARSFTKTIFLRGKG